MSQRREDKGSCGIVGCEEPAHVRGLCAACYSAWARLRNKTATEAKLYLWRTRRLAARVPALVGAHKEDNPRWDKPTKPTTPKVRHIRHLRHAS